MAERPVPAWKVGPYQLQRRLGAGGGGEVWEATSPHGEKLAVKILPLQSAEDQQRARTEVAALRWLRLPGVVSFRDEGMTQNCYWVAMDLVEGSSFPDLHSPLPWAQLKPLALRLLGLLEDVHRAGILHRDLKPANVRVDRTGALWLIDFGIAAGRALDPAAAKRHAGTPRYVAPECLHTATPSVASDLYAVGVMLREALEGYPVPADVADVITKMIHPDPQQRPPSAGHVAVRLGAREQPIPDDVVPRDLFAGPQHYLHLPELGAQRLQAESGGDSTRYPEIFLRWERLGYGHWEQGHFALDRFRLAEWGEEEEERLGAALALGAAPEWVQQKSLELAQRRLDLGHAEAALLLCERSLELAEGTTELGLLAAEAATRLESPAAFSRAICLLRRCRPDPLLVEVDLLLQASERVQTGQRREAVPLLDQMLLTLPESLEIWRQATYLQARRGTEAEEATLEGLVSWTTEGPMRLARWQGWLGNLRYRQGCYQEAADLQKSSAAGRRSPDSRIAALRAAAAALIEVPDLAEARRLSAEVRSQAALLGLPTVEAHAEWVERVAAYRMGDPLPADPERVAAALVVSPTLGALHAMQEGTSAWRAGELALALTLTTQAVAQLRRLGLHPTAALAQSLQLALGNPREGEVEGLAEELLALEEVDLSLQGLALLSVHRPGAWVDAARRLLRHRPEQGWAQRLDVLSYDECRARCGL